jgi:hypothetical protein
VDRYSSLASALEAEVLTEMAGTFFGARKGVEELAEAFQLRVEGLRGLEAKVFARVFYLRRLLLGEGGQTAFFAVLGLQTPFPDADSRPGPRGWRPERLPFALLASSRYAAALRQAYAELVHACDVYMRGEYEDDPDHKGRKRLSLNYSTVEAQHRMLNKRIEKLNGDMAPSSVLQYARNISTQEQPGQGAITNVLGAESLDKGLMFKPVDFEALKLWRAPQLPAPEACGDRIAAFARAFYRENAEAVRRVMAGL